MRQRLSLATYSLILSAIAMITLGSPMLCVAADNASPKEGPRQLRVIWLENPATTAIVSWTTNDEGKKHAVHYDTEPRSGDVSKYAQATPASRNGEYSRSDREKDKIAQSFYHHAVLTGLKPSTKYYFTISSDLNASSEHWFLTAPADDRPFEILFGGDSRSGHKERQLVNQMMAKMAEDESLIAFAHGGDYIGSGAYWNQFSLWLDHHQQTFTKDGRILPIIPTRGNHDRGELFNEIFHWPGDDRANYYTTQLSPRVALVTLNTETSTSGDQKKWLAKELPPLRKENRWLLAQYHKPAWPAVKSPSSALRDFVPLFDKHDLDLACEADGHNIKRTPPIRDGKLDKTGVTYIGEGGLGVGQRTPKKDRWWLNKPGMATRGHHVHVLSFSPKKLEIKVVLLDEQKVLETHDLQPRTQATASTH